MRDQNPIRRRLGRFYVSQRIHEGDYSTMRRLLREIVVLDIRHELAQNRAEIVAMSHHFRPVEEGEIIPFYVATIVRDHSRNEHKIRFIEGEVDQINRSLKCLQDMIQEKGNP